MKAFLNRGGRYLLCGLLFVAWGRTAAGADFEVYLTGNAADVKVIGAGPESAVNIRRRTVEKPASVWNVSVVRGALSSQPE